ncbi:MAG: cation diffusion facilitator family transporter [Methanomassiliicoccales archaeon]
MNKKQIAIMAIVGGIGIFALKLLAFLISGSMALLSDAIINIIASIMLLGAIIVASWPADENHRYGHEKAENISALVEGLLIIIAAVLIIEASIGRLLNPVSLENVDAAMLISLFATSLNGVMAVIMIRAAKKSNSIALEGDAKHLFSDVASSVGVVIGLFIASLTGWFILDPLIALAVAFLLIWMGYKVLRKTTMDLMDANCPEEETIIRNVVERCKGCADFRELKTRRSGNHVFVEFRICVDGNSTVAEAHTLTESITQELQKEIPTVVVNIQIRTKDQPECAS